jgi:hypothetical protein
MDLSNWAIVDVFTVEQAACLWVGVDPGIGVYKRSSEDEANVAAIRQALSGALASGALEGDSNLNAMSIIGDFKKSLIKRENLRAFAKRKGQRPVFLFDTLVTTTVPAENEPPEEENSTPEPTKTKGGRPQEYDWDAFTVEIIRIADGIDGLPDTQAELISQMLEWCYESWGKEPAESSVKSRISLIYNGLGKGQKPKKL